MEEQKVTLHQTSKSPTRQQRVVGSNVSPTRQQSPTRRRISSPTRQRNVSPTKKEEFVSPSEYEKTTEGIHQAHFQFRDLQQLDPTVQLFNRHFERNTHKLLGNTGIKVSRICLGTMNFGQVDANFGGSRPGQLDETEAHKILDRFVELGGNCIDTANFFPWFGSTSGESERIIGNWLSQRSDRERLFIITKIRLPTDPNNVNAVGLSRLHVICAVEASLRRLQSKYIDLLQIDGWDYTVDVKEVVRIFDELLMSGKVINMGVCDFKGWQLQRMLETTKRLNKHHFSVYEGEYNLLSRGCEMEVVDVCLNEQLGFIAYSPFKYGFLTDDEKQQHISSGGGQQQSNLAEPFESMKSNPCYKQLYNSMQRIASTRNVSLSSIALKWVLEKEFVSTVVVGVSDINELEQAMSVLTDFQLTSEEMIELNDASLPYLPYPYLGIPTDIGRGLYMNTPGPIVYSQLAYLTQAITLNDRRYDFAFPEKYSINEQQQQHIQYGMTHDKDNISSQQPNRRMFGGSRHLRSSQQFKKEPTNEMPIEQRESQPKV